MNIENKISKNMLQP